MAHIEAVRVVQDPAYAASLTDADWHTLSQDPTWNEMIGEQSEAVAPIIAQYGHKLPGGGGGSSRPTEVAVNPGYKLLGSDTARDHGSGIIYDRVTKSEYSRMA